MSKPQRCHPTALISKIITNIKGFFFLFVIIFLNKKIGGFYQFLAIGIICLLIIIYTLLHYLFKTYHVLPEHLLINHGIFMKNKTVIPYQKIQTIKQRQWFFLKPFKLVAITIETAGGQDESDASLDAVPEDVVALIEKNRGQQLTPAQSPNAIPSEALTPQQETPTSYQLSNPNIILFSMTDLSLLATGLFIFGIANDYLPKNLTNWASEQYSNTLRLNFVLIIFSISLVILLLIGIAIFRNFTRFYRFTLWRDQDTLHIERGLFQRHVQNIPVHKIQGIQIKQQLLRQVFKLSSVDLLMTTSTGDNDETSESFRLLPIISEKEVFTVLDEMIPEWQLTRPTIHHTSQKQVWYFLRWPIFYCVPAIVITSYFYWWLGLIVALLMCAWLLASSLTARYQGYAFQNHDTICLQHFSFFTKIQSFISRDRIQCFEEKNSYWLAKKKIGHASFTFKLAAGSKTIALSYLPSTESSQLKAFYQGDY